MHEILSAHPRVVEIDGKLAKLAEAEQASQDRIAALRLPYEAAVREWQDASRRAVLDGADPPDRPSEPDYGADDGAAHLFMGRRQELRDERTRVLAEIRDEIEQAAARERELVDAARRLVDELRPAAEELDGLVRAVAEVRAAHETAAGVRTSPSLVERTRSGVDVAALVAAALTGVSLLEPEPSAPRPRRGPEPPPPPRYVDRFRLGRVPGRVP